MDCIQRHARAVFLGVLACAVGVLWFAVFIEERHVLTVAFLDVGQGDAIFIEAPNGNQMLIDGGRGRAVLRGLGRVMPFYDRTVDAVLATHPDADHIGGLPDVFRRFGVAYYIHSGARADTGAYEALVRSVEEEGSTVVRARAGQTVDLGGGAALSILFPDTNPGGMDPNMASVVALLTYGDTGVLLTGDAPKRIERHIATQYGDALEVDVLKVGHHGSDTSTSGALLGFASPETAVISVGKDNRYGHPHEEVLARLRDFGAAIKETTQGGTIIFESDGDTISLR